MFRSQKSGTFRRRPEPVSPTLQMALSVRLGIFAKAEIEPAATAFLAAFSQRLDRVRSRRHSIDFETAKALAWWQGPEADRLVALGWTAISGDREIQKLTSADELEAIILQRHVEARLRAMIREGFDDMTLRLKALRDNRLNVQ